MNGLIVFYFLSHFYVFSFFGKINEEQITIVFQGYVPLISVNALHQIHIFIFFLAVFHVFYSAITMMLGRLKVRLNA